MLNKKTKALMKVILDKAMPKDGVCLVNQIDLLKDIPYTIDFKRNDLEPSLKALMLEGYFEILDTDKKGEKYYCITMMPTGIELARRIANEKRAIKFKLVLTISGCLLSYILSQIILAISRVIGAN